MPVCESDLFFTSGDYFLECAEMGEVYFAYWDDFYGVKRLIFERQPTRFISYRMSDYAYIEVLPNKKMWVWRKDIPAL